MSELSERALRKLARRGALRPSPARSIAIKRHVHEFIVDAPAEVFAESLQAVLSAPGARFGRIDVRRDPARRGRPFAVGERFHGCFALDASFPHLASALARLGLRRFTRWLEDALLSDYSEIREVSLSGGSFRASYVYLDGSPIAGESRFTVTPLGARCRFEAVFEYQEVSVVAILALHLFAARMHDDVVREQVVQAAARAGARIADATLAARPALAAPAR